MGKDPDPDQANLNIRFRIRTKIVRIRNTALINTNAVDTQFTNYFIITDNLCFNRCKMLRYENDRPELLYIVIPTKIIIFL
jgi:hypothetical protein